MSMKLDDTEVSGKDETSEERFTRLTHDDREVVTLMTSLMENAGWRALVKMLGEDLSLRRDKYEQDDICTYDALIGREFLRGEIAMLRVLLLLPEQMKDAAKEGLRMRSEIELEKDDTDD